MKHYIELLNDKSFSGIIVILDNKSNIIDANANFTSLLGYSLEEIMNTNIIEMIVPDEKSLFFDLNYTQDISNTMTLKFYHKSGAFRFFSFSIMNFDKYKILFGNTLQKDFLAKKYEYLSEKTEQIGNVFDNIDADDIKDVLSFQGNSLSLLLDLMPIEVWVKDRFGKYIFVNRTLLEATGFKFTDYLLKDDFQIFSAETAKSFVETDELTKISGKKISFNFETSDEQLSSYAEVTKIPIYNKARKYIGLLGFSINTSYSKATEVLLQKEKDRLLFVLDNIDGMIFEIDSNSKLQFISGNFKKMIGFEMKNDEIMNIFFKSTSTISAQEKLKLALSGQKIIVEAKIMGKTFSFNLTPIKNDFGSYNVVGFGSLVLNGGGENDK